MIEPLLDAWRTNNRVNLFLLDAVSDEDLDVPLEKGKPVRAQFAHLVNVRRMWLKMSARDLLDTEDKIDRRKATREELREALNATCEAIAGLLARSATPGDKVKGRPSTAATFFAVMIAHEGEHRGQIQLALRQAGRELCDEVQLGLWEWQKR